MAVVIGRAGRRIAEGAALGHIAALTLCNEGTIRDWVRHGKFNVTQGKNWDRSGGDGALAGAVPGPRADPGHRDRDPGERRVAPGRPDGADAVSGGAQIAYVSTFTTLVPGDIIVTGTPAGAGARLDPPVWLAPGDVVEVRAEGIGALVNGVADE